MRRRFLPLLLVPVLAAAVLAPLTAQAKPGDIGVFSTKCAYSHANNDDPIVYPGLQGAAHRHQYFGNVSTNYNTTSGKLEKSATNCDRTADHAAYWVPALYVDGVELPFEAAHVYYRNSGTTDKSKTVPFPRGLQMIAGTAAHPEPPDGFRTAEWACQGDELHVTDDFPPYCASQKVVATITFPSCWDGVNLTSADQSHMAYPFENTSRPRTCPSTHPVYLPEITEWVRWFPRRADMSGLTLASGSGDTIHADYWSVWDAAEEARLVTTCLIGGVTCGTVSPGAPF
jgi:hypothetical protein